MKKFLVLCIITGIVIFYFVKIDTPKLIAFMLSPLDHTFTGEINTKDYQYYGDFKYWTPHGLGKKIYSKEYFNGYFVSYEGGFHFNEYKGPGTLILWDGTRYVAEWENDVTGNGVITFPGGDKTYKGQWSEGGLNGFGTMINNHNKDTDGVYVGKWKNNMRHGQGKYTWHDGEIYEGEYANDSENGYGTLTTPNGQKFTGQFKNGVFVGN